MNESIEYQTKSLQDKEQGKCQVFKNDLWIAVAALLVLIAAFFYASAVFWS